MVRPIPTGVHRGLRAHPDLVADGLARQVQGEVGVDEHERPPGWPPPRSRSRRRRRPPAARSGRGPPRPPGRRPSLVQTAAGPGASNDPSTQSQSMASMYPGCHPSDRGMGAGSSGPDGAASAGVSGIPIDGRVRLAQEPRPQDHHRPVGGVGGGQGRLGQGHLATRAQGPGGDDQVGDRARGRGCRSSGAPAAHRAGSPPRRRTARVSSAEGGPACCSPAAQGPVVCSVERTRALSSPRPGSDSSEQLVEGLGHGTSVPRGHRHPVTRAGSGMGLTTGQRPPSSGDAHAAVGSRQTTFTGTPQIRHGGSMGPCNDRIRTNAARCVRIGGHRPQQGEGGSHETGNTICRGNSAGCLAYRGCCAECIRAHPHSWTWPGGAGRRGWRGADGGCGQQLGDSRDLG